MANAPNAQKRRLKVAKPFIDKFREVTNIIDEFSSSFIEQLSLGFVIVNVFP